MQIFRVNFYEPLRFFTSERLHNGDSKVFVMYVVV